MSRPPDPSRGQAAGTRGTPQLHGRFHRGSWPGGARVLVVQLQAGAAVGELGAEELWRLYHDEVEGRADLSSVAQYGGSAVALAAFVASARRAQEGRPDLPAPAFVISVGGAVKRGLPTAARATITGRAPLRSGLVEAPFGGQFARALAGSTDVVMVFGATPDQRIVMDLDREGHVALRQASFDAAATTLVRARQLADGRHALLVGPAAEAGLPLANLGSWSAPARGESRGAPSLVGRGGLGATVAAAGVVAVTVEAEALPLHTSTGAKKEGDLVRVLESSPRLLSRAKGGTLELGNVRGVDDSSGGHAASDAPQLRPKKHGCEGCPTPCGWQFRLPTESKSAPEVGGRFAALQGFLGKGDAGPGMQRALAALEACNLAGIDARSAALVVGEHSASRPPGSQPDPAELVGEMLKVDSPLYRRAVALRPGTDSEPAGALMPGDLAGLVGVALAARGPEPLRSLSVFGLSAMDPGRDPKRDLGLTGLGDDEEYNAGVLAHWHECYSAAVDVTGFCAFSASALLADGVLTLDELSSRVTPSLRSADWLTAGSEIVALHRELAVACPSGPSIAKAAALPEAAVRGFLVALHRRWRASTEDAAKPDAKAHAGAVHGVPAAQLTGGLVTVRAKGSLATRLAAYPGAVEILDEATQQRFLALEVALSGASDSVSSVLERLADAVPRARPWLLREGGHPLPGVLIAGRPVGGAARVRPGDVAELILVIPGG